MSPNKYESEFYRCREMDATYNNFSGSCNSSWDYRFQSYADYGIYFELMSKTKGDEDIDMANVLDFCNIEKETSHVASNEDECEFEYSEDSIVCVNEDHYNTHNVDEIELHEHVSLRQLFDIIPVYLERRDKKQKQNILGASKKHQNIKKGLNYDTEPSKEKWEVYDPVNFDEYFSELVYNYDDKPIEKVFKVTVHGNYKIALYNTRTKFVRIRNIYS